MKKTYLLGISTMATLLLATSCQEQELVNPLQPSEEVKVSVKVNTPELAVATRAFGDGQTAMDLHYAVYNVKKNANGGEELTYLPELTEEDHEIKGTTTVDLQLVTGNTYKVIFWADNENAPYYTHWEDVTNPTVTIDYDNKQNGVTCNNEDYDAFFNWMTIDVDAAKTVEIDLFRPFAQLNIGTSDIVQASQAGYTLQQTQVKVKTYTTLNLWDKTVDGLTDVVVDFQATDYPNYDASAKYCLKASTVEGYETFPVQGYEYMAMTYLLRPVDKELADVEFLFYSTEDEVKERTYASVPLQRNWRTNIYGQLITSDVDVNVEIVPAFDGAYNIEVWDGHTLTMPRTEGGITYVAQGAELAYIANALNGGGQSNAENNGTRAGGVDYKKATIHLTNNIDLGGENWNPIKGFEGKFDGNGYTISNLKVKTEGKASAGLFASAKYIKNLKVKDANIQGHYKTGVIVGDGLCARIENCHVENASVVATPYENDYANHVGGIVGYLSAENEAYVKNSSVKNATITGYRDVAGIAGTANQAAIVSVCKVENVTVTADQTSEYKEVKDANAGAIVGRIHAKATVENNTVGEGVEVIRKVDLTQEMEYAVAEAQNGDVIYVGNGEVALPHFTNKALTFVGIHENAAIAEPVTGSQHAYFKDSSLSFENLKFKGSGYSGSANGYVQSASETYTNCAFVDGYYMFAGDETVVTGCTFTGKQGQYFWTGTPEEITFNGCSFNGVDRAVKVCAVGDNRARVATFNECTFTGTEQNKAALEIDGSKGSSYVVNINNCTATGFATSEATAESLFNIVGADKVVVYVDGDKWLGQGLFQEENGNQVAYTEAGLKAALDNGASTIYLAAGDYVLPHTAKGKTVSFIGTGNPEDVRIAVTKVGTGGENCDYALDGSTVVFENITITTNSSTYIGYARCNGTYNNCVINGTYTLYGNSEFNNCTFNVSGNVYNLWTWGAPNAEFNSCTFNSDGKALLLYGRVNTNLTVDGCTFNDNGGLSDLKAAIEIGNDYNTSYNVVVDNTTVNGYEINDKGINTGTTLWGNKNSMPKEKLNVVVDGVDVY